MSLPIRRGLLIFFCSLLPAIGLAGCINKKSAETPVQRPKIQEVVNSTPLTERVYTTIEFASASRFPLGRELMVNIAEGRNATAIEYELEYQAGTLVQAGVGSIIPTQEKPPYKRATLLGSCSAGGACSYHEDVKGGTLLVRFKGSSVGNLKGEWNYYAPGNDGKLSSRDAKFQLDAPSLKSSYTLISQTLGLPKAVDSDVLAGPYHLAATANKFGQIRLTVRLAEEAPGARLFYWDGKSYAKINSETSGKTLTATITSAGTYVVTK